MNSAKFEELEDEWLNLQQYADQWNSNTDLQLAAELGKTLLERNRDLETTVHQQQHNLQDQSQEIEYLGKQNAALRQCSESRLRLCEQLEANVADLERQLQKQSTDWHHDKRRLKTLLSTVESLEQKCEDLQKCVELQRAPNIEQESNYIGHAMSSHNQWLKLCQDRKLQRRHSSTAVLGFCSDEEKAAEDIQLLHEQFQDLRNQLKLHETLRLQEQRHQEVLEHELAALKQENAALTATLYALRSGIQRVNSLEQELASLEFPHKHRSPSPILSHELERELKSLKTASQQPVNETFPWSCSKNEELFLALDSQRLQLQDRYDELALQKTSPGPTTPDPWSKTSPPTPKLLSLNEELKFSSIITEKGPEMSLASCDVTDAINLIGSAPLITSADQLEHQLAPEETWSLDLMSLNHSFLIMEDSGPTSLLFLEKPAPWHNLNHHEGKVEHNCADSLSIMSSKDQQELKLKNLDDDEEETSSSSSSGFAEESRSHQSTQTETNAALTAHKSVLQSNQFHPPSFTHCRDLFDQLYTILRSNL